MLGRTCRNGDRCLFGHVCPNGSGCALKASNKCRFQARKYSVSVGAYYFNSILLAAGMHPELVSRPSVESPVDPWGSANPSYATSASYPLKPTDAWSSHTPVASSPMVLTSALTSTEVTVSPESRQALRLADLVRFVPLIEALTESKTMGRESPNWAMTAGLTKKRSPSAFQRGLFRLYLEEARKAGIVLYGGTPQRNDDFVRLLVQDIQSAV